MKWAVVSSWVHNVLASIDIRSDNLKASRLIFTNWMCNYYSTCNSKLCPRSVRSHYIKNSFLKCDPTTEALSWLKWRSLWGNNKFYTLQCSAVFEIVGLAAQFATQNCLGCYSKLNLGRKFHAEVVIHLPHIKLRILYILNIIL